MSQEDKNLNAFLSSVDELYKPIVGGRPTETGFDRDFQELKRLSTGLKQSKEHKALVGQKPENKKKNRYKDITPFDVSRVKLTVTNDDPNSDYINASFIKGAEGHQNYIASQGPLPHTVLDFWQMLWQYNVSVIVMVCREIELGKKKCERYWADQEPKNFGGITVSLSERHDLSDGYCQRTIKAQKGSEIRYLQQFHYTSWPDHGVPKLCSEIITLINHVRDVQLYSKDETSPLCVHCSAGCGRTGAVLALDYVRNLLETKKVPPGLKMYDIIAEMRRQRPAIVQTKDQYEFVNMAVAEMFRIYMKTRTVTYKEFNVGYQGEQYVNINITGEEKSKDKRNSGGSQRPLTNLVSYENVNLRNGPTISLAKEAPRQGLLEGYPDNPPPPKPALRPVSILLPDNTSLGHTLGAFAGRKQSAPCVMSQLGGMKQNATSATTPQKLSPLTPNAKSRWTNLFDVSLLSPASRGRSPSGSPMATEKEGRKTTPPAGKLKLKPDPAPKNLTTTPPPKSPGVAKLTVTAKPKAVKEMKKKGPNKPKRSMRIKSTKGAAVPATPSTAANKTSPSSAFQKYQKKNLYSDIVINENDENPKLIVEAECEGFPDRNITPRSNSPASLDKSSPSSRASTPPMLPARTIESQMLLNETPPELPTRTEESYMTLDDTDEQQPYEASDATLLASPSPVSVYANTARRPSGNIAAGTRGFAAKAKNIVGKTTNKLSKVGASKSNDEDSSVLSTVENRTPSYTPEPVMYGGQDLSFGKRFMRKVKGGRKPM